MSLSIRTHALELLPTESAARPNVVPGRVLDHAYMGSHRDYVVGVGAAKVKVTAPPSQNIAVGEEVSVHFPPQHCRGLVR